MWDLNYLHVSIMNVELWNCQVYLASESYFVIVTVSSDSGTWKSKKIIYNDFVVISVCVVFNVNLFLIQYFDIPIMAWIALFLINSDKYFTLLCACQFLSYSFYSAQNQCVKGIFWHSDHSLLFRLDFPNCYSASGR